MNSRVTDDFIDCFRKIPENAREQARRAYRAWQRDQNYPSLHYKRIHAREPIYSIRIGRSWRALGLKQGDTMTWFWIGSHADYDNLLSQL